MELNEKDIEKLDFILDRMIESNWLVSANDLHQAGIYNEYHDNIELIEKDFRYLLSVFNEMNLGEVSMTADAEAVKPNDKAIIFHRKGGFKDYQNKIRQKQMESVLTRFDDDKRTMLDDRIQELTAENLEYHKEQRDKDEQIKNLTKDNLRLGNWDIRFRWAFYVVSAIVGFIIKWLIDL